MVETSVLVTKHVNGGQSFSIHALGTYVALRFMDLFRLSRVAATVTGSSKHNELNSDKV